MPLNNDYNLLYFYGGYKDFYTFVKIDNHYLLNLLSKYLSFSINKFDHLRIDNEIMRLFPDAKNNSHVLIQITNSNINRMMRETNILNHCSIIKYVSLQQQYKFTLGVKHLISLNNIGVHYYDDYIENKQINTVLYTHSDGTHTIHKTDCYGIFKMDKTNT